RESSGFCLRPTAQLSFSAGSIWTPDGEGSAPMDDVTLEKLLRQVQRGKTSVADALSRLKDLPFAELGYATVDTHRSLRMGVPEVVFGPGKTAEQLRGIVGTLSARRQSVLVTRIGAAAAAELRLHFPAGRYHELARIFHLQRGKPRAGVV